MPYVELQNVFVLNLSLNHQYDCDFQDDVHDQIGHKHVVGTETNARLALLNKNQWRGDDHHIIQESVSNQKWSKPFHCVLF